MHLAVVVAVLLALPGSATAEAQSDRFWLSASAGVGAGTKRFGAMNMVAKLDGYLWLRGGFGLVATASGHHTSDLDAAVMNPAADGSVLASSRGARSRLLDHARQLPRRHRVPPARLCSAEQRRDDLSGAVHARWAERLGRSRLLLRSHRLGAQRRPRHRDHRGRVAPIVAIAAEHSAARNNEYGLSPQAMTTFMQFQVTGDAICYHSEPGATHDELAWKARTWRFLRFLFPAS